MKHAKIIFSIDLRFCPLILVSLFFCLPQGSLATIRNVPSTYLHIQAAIDAANMGDTILVADGIFTGPGIRGIQFKDKSLVLKSVNGPEYTTLDFGSDSAHQYGGIKVDSGQANETIIEGFTFRGGATPYFNGSALHCYFSSPIIKNCVFTGNRNTVIRLDSSLAVFENCSIIGNSEADEYGTIFCRGSDPIFNNCLIAHNDSGPAFYFHQVSNDPWMTCCNIYGNSGGNWTDDIAFQKALNNNQELDPRICDVTTNDLHLQSNSPCLSENNNCGLIGALGGGCLDGVSPYADELTVTPIDTLGRVASAQPTISWSFVDTGLATQQAYVVEVTWDMDTTGLPWFIDTVYTSDTSIHYTGAELLSHTQYRFRIKLIGEYGSGPWREVAIFTQHSKRFYVPESQPTIQDGIDVATTGDTVFVMDGHYTGEGNRKLVIANKNISLKSVNGPQVTVLDAGAQYQTKVLVVAGGTDSTCVIDGFTIRGGRLNSIHDFPGGSGIESNGSSPVIRNCIFLDNLTGSGVSGFRSNAVIEYCTFIGNSANFGSAVCGWESHITIRHCNIVYNTGAEAVQDVNNDPAYPFTIECTNIYSNNGDQWDFHYITVNDTATDILSFDPLHCDGQSMYQTLNSQSPCLPSNNACSALIGAVDSVCLSTDVESDEPIPAPASFEILRTYPNPFNSATIVEFSLPKRSQWSVEVFNVLGQRIVQQNGTGGPGVVTTRWEPKDIASGLYFYKVTAGKLASSAKVMYLK